MREGERNAYIRSQRESKRERERERERDIDTKVKS